MALIGVNSVQSNPLRPTTFDRIVQGADAISKISNGVMTAYQILGIEPQKLAMQKQQLGLETAKTQAEVMAQGGKIVNPYATPAATNITPTQPSQVAPTPPITPNVPETTGASPGSDVEQAQKAQAAAPASLAAMAQGGSGGLSQNVQASPRIQVGDLSFDMSGRPKAIASEIRAAQLKGLYDQGMQITDGKDPEAMPYKLEGTDQPIAIKRAPLARDKAITFSSDAEKAFLGGDTAARFNVVDQATRSALSYMKNGQPSSNPSDQQALLYAYFRSLNPDMKRTGEGGPENAPDALTNFNQKWEEFKTKMMGPGGIIVPEVQKNILSTMMKNYASQRALYDQEYKRAMADAKAKGISFNPQYLPPIQLKTGILQGGGGESSGQMPGPDE